MNGRLEQRGKAGHLSLPPEQMTSESRRNRKPFGSRLPCVSGPWGQVKLQAFRAKPAQHLYFPTSIASLLNGAGRNFAKPVLLCSARLVARPTLLTLVLHLADYPTRGPESVQTRHLKGQRIEEPKPSPACCRVRGRDCRRYQKPCHFLPAFPGRRRPVLLTLLVKYNSYLSSQTCKGFIAHG